MKLTPESHALDLHMIKIQSNTMKMIVNIRMPQKLCLEKRRELTFICGFLDILIWICFCVCVCIGVCFACLSSAKSYITLVGV